ncbi:MAG: protein-L-isoaspartate O-methyltransferase [Pseudomonadota bacterium]
MGDVIADPFRSARLVLSLRQAGVTDSKTLQALETVSRAAFVPAELEDLAFEDCVLPAPCGEVIVRPVEAGVLLQTLNMGGRVARTLLLGGGPGYLAALLAELSEEVFVVSRYQRAVSAVQDAFAKLGVDAVHLRHGDPAQGWAERGPFDRILIAAAVDEPPDAVRLQLAQGGRLLAAIARRDGQSLAVFDPDGRVEAPRVQTRLSPLVIGKSAAL